MLFNFDLSTVYAKRASNNRAQAYFQCGYKLRVTQKTSFSAEYITPRHIQTTPQISNLQNFIGALNNISFYNDGFSVI